MTIRQVLEAPHPTLSYRCDAVSRFDGPLGRLAMDLLQTMYHAEGRGLAAPQIGVTQRVFVMDAGWKTGAPMPMVFVNPEIVGQSEEKALGEEQCLSIPDRAVTVSRAVWVALRWQDLAGLTCEGHLTGFEAVCVQHERDHLDGILITDDLP